MIFLTQEHKGSAYALLSGFLYGFIGYLGVTIIQANFSVYTMLFWRFFISAIIILPLLIPTLKNGTGSLSANLKIMLCGGVFYSASTILFFMGSGYIGTGLSMVIFFTYPAVVLLFNWLFFKAQPTRVYYIAIAIITIGLCLLVDLSDLKFDLIGIGIGIVSAFAYAGYIVLSKSITTTPLMSSFMVSAGCAATCLILALIDGSFIIPSTPHVWVNFLGFGIMCTALPILLLLEALKNITSEKASILSVLEPLFVAIFGVLLLNEHLKPLQAIGIIIVLGGALITLLSNNKNFQKLIRCRN